MKLLSYISIAIIMFGCQSKKAEYKYPESRKSDKTNEYFGTTVNDPYNWLEEENSPDVKQWIEKQNEVTSEFLESIPFRNDIKQRLTELYKFSKVSAPFKKGKYFFQFKNNGKQNQDILYIKNSPADSGEIILNPNELSEDGTAALGNIEISKNSKYLAYTISHAGSDWNDIYIIDLEKKACLKDIIERVKFSQITWYKDGFFYNGYGTDNEKSLTDGNANQKVFYHRIGTSQKEDKVIYENSKAPNNLYETFITSDDKYLVISFAKSTSGNGIIVKNLSNNEERVIYNCCKNDYIFSGSQDGRMLILTNEGAANYKLIKVSPTDGSSEDLIPEKENVLQYCKLTKTHIAAVYLKNAYHNVRIYSKKGIYNYDIQLPGKGTITEFNTSPDSDVAYYSYTSFNIPEIAISYNFENKRTHIISKPDIKFRTSDYVTEQVFYKSKDGTRIPMFITHRKDVKLNGKNPCLLYGYGGFNISLTPTFNPRNILWMEAGGIYAVANLRGGGEYGKDWHKAGTKMSKQNVFDDFISAAEYLIDNDFTSEKLLAVHGGSNGGLLVGAVTNQRPDLFRVALPAVGVMDMLRYHRFTIGYAWASDYGTADDSIEMFRYLKKYSPVHNVTPNTKYPAVLVTTADHDDRVVPAHSFKYIAELQAKNTGKYPTMIRIEHNAGHGAGMPVSKQIELYTDIWAFTLYNMNIEYNTKR